jgi:hypothetical protein
LAPPEYVSRDPNKSSQVYWARIQLLEAVQRVYPVMLERLSADVFPHYLRLAHYLRLETRFDFDRMLSAPGVSPWKALPGDSELKRALDKWAADYNADEEWLKNDALHILRGWYVTSVWPVRNLVRAPESMPGNWRKSLRFAPYHARLISTAGENFHFSYAGWELEWQSWLAYSKLVREEFERSLSDYEKCTRKLAESRDLVRTRRTYSPQNFDWFVLYQFDELSTVAVAKWWKAKGKGQILESTVFRGIKTVQKLVAWQRLRTTSRPASNASSSTPRSSGQRRSRPARDKVR